MDRKHYSCIVFALLAVVLGGCGSGGPEVAPVSGRVTLDGQPLANADVIFQPEGAKRPSYGRTDNDGKYQLMYQQGKPGALVGPHTIRITEVQAIVGHPDRVPPDESLKRDVESGDNVFDFDLKTTGK